jgi:hypothetical protein
MTQPLTPSATPFDPGGQDPVFVTFLRRTLMSEVLDMQRPDIEQEMPIRPAIGYMVTTKIGALTLSADFDEVIAAMGEVQAAINVDGLLAHAKNDVLQNAYAPLQTILKALSPSLRKNGVTLLQPYETKGGTVKVTTIFMKGKQFASMTAEMTADNPFPQAIGSAITYCCRYSIRAMLGLAVDTPADRDDDGNMASGTVASETASKERSTKESATRVSTAPDADCKDSATNEGLVTAKPASVAVSKERTTSTASTVTSPSQEIPAPVKEDISAGYSAALRRFLKSTQTANLEQLGTAKKQIQTFRLTSDEQLTLEKAIDARIAELNT